MHIHTPCASAEQLLEARGRAHSRSRRWKSAQSRLPGRCSGRGFRDLAGVTDLAPIPEVGGTAPACARQVGARSGVGARRAGAQREVPAAGVVLSHLGEKGWRPNGASNPE